MKKEGNHLYFEVQLVGPEFATAERITQWQSALQRLFDQPFTIEVASSRTHIDTPAAREEQLKALRKHEAQQVFVQDEYVQDLVIEFGAEIDADSIEPLI